MRRTCPEIRFMKPPPGADGTAPSVHGVIDSSGRKGTIMQLRIILLVAAAWALSVVPASAQMTAGPSDDVESIINGMGPGDELVLDDGTYTIDQRFYIDIAGTESQPIIIRAADGATPHFVQTTGENIWDIDAAYVEIRGLEFSEGSAGLRFQSLDHVTVEDCEIHDTGDVALRMNDGGQVYESPRIIHNHIHDTNNTGEGMYLGCNEDGCQVANGQFIGNYVHHTNGPTVDQGDGIELKEGSFDNVIRDNVIHDTNYPCILTYSAVGNGGPNVIERNVLWNCAMSIGDNGIQSAADAIIRNNIILSAGGTGIAMQPHQNGAPSNLTVVHNTILVPGSGAGIRVSGVVGPVLIANNAVYAEGGSAINGGGGMVTVTGNVTDGDIAMDFISASFSGEPPNDVFPATGGALVGAGDAAHVVPDDFNGTDRMGVADVGAYAYAAGGNPGWVIIPGFRDAIGPPPGTDGGVLPGTDGGVLPGTDGGPRRDGGGTTGGDAGPGGGGDDGGCGCRVASRRAPLPVLAVCAFVVALVLRRRR
jgi:hypothetical protein